MLRRTTRECGAPVAHRTLLATAGKSPRQQRLVVIGARGLELEPQPYINWVSGYSLSPAGGAAAKAVQHSGPGRGVERVPSARE
jgi:hypothetical protein